MADEVAAFLGAAPEGSAGGLGRAGAHVGLLTYARLVKRLVSAKVQELQESLPGRPRPSQAGALGGSLPGKVHSSTRHDACMPGEAPDVSHLQIFAGAA